MSEPDRPLLADAKEELGRLRDELVEMFRLRWQLAWLELRGDLAALKRFVVALIIAAVMALTALPLFCACLADMLDERLGIPRTGWLLVIGATLCVSATLIVWLARRRFRRQFVGLEQTLEELREDAEWLQEWSGRDENRDTTEP
jgi:uncharacterized membrane protein YqjE